MKRTENEKQIRELREQIEALTESHGRAADRVATLEREIYEVQRKLEKAEKKAEFLIID